MKAQNDFENYRKMLVPFESIEIANKSAESFFEAVKKARNEFHIANVHIIMKVNVMDGASEKVVISSSHFGNTLEGPAMCAWAILEEEEMYRAAKRAAKRLSKRTVDVGSR
ncbi:MAG: hypothetical protein EHM48_00905 [Planctomycetaceae bacterium]|nr:MAG: hypothetical protein EHM48_00905 [Planctomycetaceae bacterium]